MSRRVVGWAVAYGLLAGLVVVRGANPQQLPEEVVILRDGGFYPAKITRGTGKFLLVVDNRSHSRQIQLGINGLVGGMVSAIQGIVGGKDYVLDLAADSYTIKESSHPNWTPLTIVLQ